MRFFLHFLLIVILILPVCSSTLYGQGQSITPESEFHNHKFFLELARSGLIDKLNKASIEQQNEITTLKGIVAKNDSLLESGNLYDTVSTDVGQHLLNMQLAFDSIANSISTLLQKLDSKKNFRRHHMELQSATNSLVNKVSDISTTNRSVFKSMNLQLDTSNLAGEKRRLTRILNAAALQQEKEKVIIGKIDNHKDSQLNSGNLEDSISGKIDNRLKNYQRKMDSISVEITALKQKINSPKEFKKDFTLIKIKVLLIDSVVNKNAVVREYVFEMIEDGLSKSKPNLFNLAAFFGPGGYIIPESKIYIAKKYFSPIIDSLVKFSNHYATVLREAIITVNGYADGSNIGKGSKLYNTLVAKLDIPNPEKQDLNKALSALRAEKIAIFLTQLLRERFPEFNQNNKIVFESHETGKGETIPDPKIIDYKLNDDRRRIVIIFWNVLPFE